MDFKAKSLRPFLGSKDFEISRQFYVELGFEEIVLWEGFCVFSTGDFAFYLQAHYVKDWIDNTMVFMEVENLDELWDRIDSQNLPQKFDGVRVSEIKEEHWGREFFVHDPSGILWHFGTFASV